jgi:Tol biopolymer transport system component
MKVTKSITQKFILCISILMIILLVFKGLNYLLTRLSLSKVKIVFINYNAEHRNIYSANLDGSELTPLTDNHGQKSSPIWSPDGNKIAFIDREKGYSQIYVMNSNGTSKTILAEPAKEILE